MLGTLRRGNYLSVGIAEAVMSTSAGDYRANAARCEQMAEQEREAVLSRQYREIARQWQSMADSADIAQDTAGPPRRKRGSRSKQLPRAAPKRAAS